MALRFIALFFILIFVAQTAASGDVWPKISDPVSDYINKAVLCTNLEEQILRKTEDAKLWLSTDFSIGQKVGQWQLYIKEQELYVYSGSEPRDTGEWMSKVEKCVCSQAIKQKCDWRNWREP